MNHSNSVAERDQQIKGTPQTRGVKNKAFGQWWAENKHQFPSDTVYWVARAIFAAGQNA